MTPTGVGEDNTIQFLSDPKQTPAVQAEKMRLNRKHQRVNGIFRIDYYSCDTKITMGEENSIQFLSDPKQTQVAVQGSRMSRKVAEQKAPECEEDIPD